MTRKFTAYELNLLIEAGLDPKNISNIYDPEIPVEYIVNFAYFYSRKFFVDKNVLIPRPETEEVINLALKKISAKKGAKALGFIDVGSGSGVVGITFALELAKLNIDFEGYIADISSAALEVTKKNLLNFNFTKESENLFKLQNSIVHVVQSDLLDNVDKEFRPDIILANLPYIPTERISTLQNSVKNFEPNIALDGGRDGLLFIRKLLLQATSLMSEDGLILLEVDDSHTSTEEFNDIWDIEKTEDLNGKQRFWIATKKALR